MNLPGYIRSVIFDADGTLLDSMSMWDSLDGEMLRRCGVCWTPEIGSDLRAIHYQDYPAYFRRNFGITCTDAEFADEVDRMAHSHYLTDVAAKSGAADLLRTLRARGISCCVATASQKSGVTAALDRLGLLPYLDFVMTCSEVGKSKEDPAVFHACAEKMGTSPSDTAVAEDSLHALRTAAAAGYFTIGVYDNTARIADLTEIRGLADLYVKKLEEIAL